MAEPASNILSDALTGKPADSMPAAVSASPSDSSMAPMPVSSVPAVPPMSAPMAMPETDEVKPEMPVSEEAASLTPTPPLTPTPVTLEPTKPLEPVMPASELPVAPPAGQPVSPQPAAQPAMADKKSSLPTGAIVAAVAIVAVVTLGVGAGVVLTGQSQDIRQQAAGFPSPRPASNAAANPSDIIVISAAENGFISARNQYPNVAPRAIGQGDITGELFVAESDDGLSRTYFAELAGLEQAPTSQPMAWLQYPDDTFVQIGTILPVTTERGLRSYVAYEDFKEIAPTHFIISLEDLTALPEEADLIQPTEKVIDVAL